MKYVFKKLQYKIAISILDIAGSIIFFPKILFKKNPPSDPRNILIVRLDHIGDFVCTTPLFKNIKKKFPHAKITLLVNSAAKELAYRDPNIDKVITFSTFYLARNEKTSTFKGLMRVVKDVKNIGFDLGIEPRGDMLSIIIMWLGGVKYRAGYGITGGGFLLSAEVRYDKTIHIIDRNLALLKELGIPADDRMPEVHFNNKDIETVEGLPACRQAGFGKAVAIHPFAGAKAKEWPEENFQNLINRIKVDGRDVLLIGSAGDEGQYKNVIDIKGKLSLPQLAYLIKKIGFFIGLDSGPANIAAVLNVPSVIICSGTNTPKLWIPNNSNVKFVCVDTECKPCENKICPKSEHECMDKITVEEVLGSFKELTGQ